MASKKDLARIAKRMKDAHALIESEYGWQHREHGKDCHIAEWLRAYKADPKSPNLQEGARYILSELVEQHPEPCRADDGKPCAICAWLGPTSEEAVLPMGVLASVGARSGARTFVGDVDVEGPYGQEDVPHDLFTLKLEVGGLTEEAKDAILRYLREGSTMRVRAEAAPAPPEAARARPPRGKKARAKKARK